MFLFCRRLSLMLGLCLYFSFAHAAILREDIGELKIHDLLLRPNFLLQEPRDGNFSIGESSVALRWELEQKYSGVIRIGPRSLLDPTARYTKTVNDDITLVEAFAEYNDVYGRVRFGRLPVEFGYEGKQWERNLVFPRSMLFSKRIMMLRDNGISYEISENNWYTGFVIHNGESDDDVDGRAWYTAHWGYKGDNFDLGIAGQTGSTRPIATLNSGDTLANVDVTRDEKWRIGGLYTNLLVRRWEWTLEAYIGQLEQGTTETKFATGHTDISYEITKRWSTHFRFDHFNNDLQVSGQAETQLSLAVMLSNQTQSSKLILVGMKDLVQGGRTASDSLQIIWSLSPSGIVRF